MAKQIAVSIVLLLLLPLLLLLFGCPYLEKQGQGVREGIREELGFYLVTLDVGPNYVYLKNASCKLYIGIDEGQARSILEGIKGIKGKRPSTHDLIADILSKLNVTISVKITHIEDGIFYSVLEIDGVSIDSRPSDAIAIAVRTNAPIYVSKDLMHKYGECAITDVKTL